MLTVPYSGDSRDMLAALHALHSKNRFRLATGAGLEGVAHLNGDPQALVAELIRLASFGAHVEAEAQAAPNRKAVTVVRAARAKALPATREAR